MSVQINRVAITGDDYAMNARRQEAFPCDASNGEAR